MNSAACKLNVGRISVTFICHSVGGGFNCKWRLYSILHTVHVRAVYVEAEQKNPKQNNRTWLEGLLTIREYQTFLEGGKLVAGVASVACIVSHRYPISIVFGFMQEYCRRLQVLPDTSMCSTFSWINIVASSRRLLLCLQWYILNY